VLLSFLASNANGASATLALTINETVNNPEKQNAYGYQVAPLSSAKAD
jgi:hypothetical protein